MKLLTGTLGIALFCSALMGCTPNVEPTPTLVVTPTVTPTPQWTADEQAAIDTVQKYMEIWSEISQNLDYDTDLSRISEVASMGLTSHKISKWLDWLEMVAHLVGAPTFEVISVNKGVQDSQGQLYHVRGCYSMEGSYFVDGDGKELPKGGKDRHLGRYDVLKTDAGRYLVTEDVAEETPC